VINIPVEGHLLVGSLKFQYLELVKLNGDKVIDRQKIATDVGRVCNVAQGQTASFTWELKEKESLKLYPIMITTKLFIGTGIVF
jgi:hypothetical protein